MLRVGRYGALAWREWHPCPKIKQTHGARRAHTAPDSTKASTVSLPPPGHKSPVHTTALLPVYSGGIEEQAGICCLKSHLFTDLFCLFFFPFSFLENIRDNINIRVSKYTRDTILQLFRTQPSTTFNNIIFLSIIFYNQLIASLGSLGILCGDTLFSCTTCPARPRMARKSSGMTQHLFL